MADSHVTINVGGILCKVYNKSGALSSKLPIGVLIATHGRGGSQEDLKELVNGVIATCEEKRAQGKKQKRALVVVTLDQRNHASRLVDEMSNSAFEKNPNHAMDMYAIQRGTARDISLLVDFLPMYLFPEEEAEVDEFFVTGVSLGGHATWITLKEDRRIRVGVPIIGCPDYLSLITSRLDSHKSKLEASFNGLPPFKPAFPASLLHLIETQDPAATEFQSKDPEHNPFIGKRVLALTGKEDTLVPSKFTRPFFDGLFVGDDGAKEMVEEKGAGHEVTSEMIRRTGEWIWKHGLSEEGTSIITAT